MSILLGAIKIIIVLGTLITIHELGHFTVAKLCKIKVHKFAIGFGPILWKKQGKETEYTLRLIPFGGFVQLEGEEERSEDERAFNQKPIYQRILVVAAGATVNILFALLLYMCICFNSNVYIDNVVSYLPEDSYEAISGLRSGDRIIGINHKKVLVGYDVTNVIEKSKRDDFILEIERDGKKEEIEVTLPIYAKGMLGIIYNTDREIVGFSNESSASEAGLKEGDEIIKINDTIIMSWEEIASLISQLPDQQVQMVVNREGKELSFSLHTRSVKERHYDMKFGVIHPTGFSKFRYAWNEMQDYWKANLEGIVTLFTQKEENVQVMGVVGIAGEISSTSTLTEFFYLMSAISISLGIFNLLPIPALDGGKILILVIEKIRRKPLKEGVEASLTLIGFSIIMLLALVVTVLDIMKLF